MKVRLVTPREDGRPQRVKCPNCRAIVAVSGLSACPCGQKFLPVEGGKQVRQVVIGGER